MFDNRETFDIGRKPNRRLAFGIGPHVCLGAQLARIEMRTRFTELLALVGTIELVEPPVLKPTVFVGGVKSLTVNCSP